MVNEGDAPADRDERNLSPVVTRAAGVAETRPGQRPVRARTAASHRVRDTARPGAGRGRAAESEDRRTERDAAAAAGHLGEQFRLLRPAGLPLEGRTR